MQYRVLHPNPYSPRFQASALVGGSARHRVAESGSEETCAVVRLWREGRREVELGSVDRLHERRRQQGGNLQRLLARRPLCRPVVPAKFEVRECLQCRRLASPDELVPVRLVFTVVWHRPASGDQYPHSRRSTSFNISSTSSGFEPAAMCGIFFSLSRHEPILLNPRTAHLLKSRGPDSLGTLRLVIPGDHSPDTPASDIHVTFVTTVLSLRGTTITEQPLKDESSGSVLCWNGEAWSIADQPVSGSDSRAVFNTLLASPSTGSIDAKAVAIEDTIRVMSSIKGPYAFVYYDARHRCLFYGRDCLGRRSLLRKRFADGSLVLSSVCDNTTGENWGEIEADGIYLVDLSRNPDSTLPAVTHIPHRLRGDDPIKGLHSVGELSAPRRPLKE
jgi:hypothetical protein